MHKAINRCWAELLKTPVAVRFNLKDLFISVCKCVTGKQV